MLILLTIYHLPLTINHLMAPVEVEIFNDQNGEDIEYTVLNPENKKNILNLTPAILQVTCIKDEQSKLEFFGKTDFLSVQLFEDVVILDDKDLVGQKLDPKYPVFFSGNEQVIIWDSYRDIAVVLTNIHSEETPSIPEDQRELVPA